MHREDGSMDTHSKPPKLMDRVRATLRVKRCSPRTEKTYCYWIRYFIRFHGVRNPASMGAPEVKTFLEHLAVDRYVAAATQNHSSRLIGDRPQFFSCDHNVMGRDPIFRTWQLEPPYPQAGKKALPVSEARITSTLWHEARYRPYLASLDGLLPSLR